MCSTRWVHDLVVKEVLPKPVKGFFVLEECVPKYIKFLRASNSGEEYQRMRSLHLGQKIEKLRLETKLIEKSVVPADHAEETLRKAGAAFEQASRNFPWRLASILTQVRNSKFSDTVYEKFLAQIIKRAFNDMLRYNFFQLPKETPPVQLWEVDLLKLQVITPDKDGNVLFYDGSEGKKLIKARTLLNRKEKKDGKKIEEES
jgi:hypothetical protein